MAGKENLGVGGRVLFTDGEFLVGLCSGDFIALVITGGGVGRFALFVGDAGVVAKLVCSLSGERGAAPFVEKADVGGFAALYVVDGSARVLEFDLALYVVEGRGRLFMSSWEGVGACDNRRPICTVADDATEESRLCRTPPGKWMDGGGARSLMS